MSIYFQSRAAAGDLLADQLAKYRYENAIVLALGPGAVQVGERIASRIHCVITMLLLEQIEVPGESLTFGMVDQQGGFSYDHGLSEAEQREYYNEFHGTIEDQKRQSFQHMSRLLGDSGILNNDMLRDRVVIVVADGLSNGRLIDATADFLKPIRLERLVMAVPVAAVDAVDRMHIIADELHVLGVADNYLSTDHYYEVNDTPSQEETIKKINQIILNWQ